MIKRKTNRPWLIVGVGSSGQRFAAILRKLKQPVVFYKHRPNLKVPASYRAVETLTDLRQYQAAIISSSTATHLFYLKKFINAGVPVLVDKPLSKTLTGLSPVIKLAQSKKIPLQVGFNLRFLPIVQQIKQLLNNGKLGKIYHAELYVGQYLPQWRPLQDYRQTYSANYAQGGGVVLDLIHEVDLAYHFFPTINLKPVISTKVSNLELDVEDLVILQTDQAPFITVKLDYLNHSRTRKYLIIGERGAIDCDIINHRFKLTNHDGVVKKIIAARHFDLMKTYESELKYFIKTIKGQEKIKVTNRELAVDALKTALKARKHVSGL